jgi:AcrR family transcriptional regulator
MARPSRNVDQLLIEAGRTLLPQTGLRRLSIRAVTERAGVNLGMFHYHFKTKDVFVRAILQQTYNDMFASLQMTAHSGISALDNLRASINLLARFGRDNRQLIVRLAGDALAGDAMAIEFLRANMPRHIEVIMQLLVQAQNEKSLRTLALPQALAFLIGGTAAPLLVGAAAIDSGFARMMVAQQLVESVFTDAAISERIDMALAGMAAPKRAGGRR